MYAIGVVAHTSRADQALKLADLVNADYLSTDNGTLGCAGNHKAVQQHLAGLPTAWSVLLEDDAMPVDGLREQLDQSLPMSPAPIMSLYLGRRYPTRWQNRIVNAIASASTANWIISTHLLHAVGYAIRTDLIPSLLAHPDARPTPDERITHWARRYGHLTAYAWPSLVDHADGPSATTHRGRAVTAPGRRAWATGRHTEWTTESVPLHAQ